MKKELLELFHYNLDTATASAFNQQREKILPEALEFLFQEFSNAFVEYQTYRGYQLLACDGTNLNIARNPSDQDNYFQSNPGEQGFNQLHLNALYDLCSRWYVDAVIQPGRKNNEYRALADMIDRCISGHKTIFIADRGYESYNIFAHAERRDMYYLIRVREAGRGMSFGLPRKRFRFIRCVSAPDADSQTDSLGKGVFGLYNFFPANSTFDYLEQSLFVVFKNRQKRQGDYYFLISLSFPGFLFVLFFLT